MTKVTNKMPVVGKRYRYRDFPKMEATVNAIKEGQLFTATQIVPFVHFEPWKGPISQGPIRLDFFWDYFLDLDEELPASNLQKNKMPVVGKRYRNIYLKKFGRELILKVAAIDRDDILGHVIYFEQPNEGCFSCIQYFWDDYEELPEDNLQEVERALEELKNAMIDAA